MYTNIFGTAFGSITSGCDYSKETLAEDCEGQYQLGVVMFGVIVALITSLDYIEQVALQYVMMVFQLIVVVIVIGYSLWRLNASGGEVAHVVAVDFDHLGRSTTLLIYAGNYHGVFPSIVAASHQSQSLQKSVIVLVAISLVVIYGSLGLVSSIAVPLVPDNISHLLVHEDFGYSAAALPWYLGALKMAVVLFPVADICSNAPVIGQAMCGIVISLFWGTEHKRIREQHAVKMRFGRAVTIIPAVVVAWNYHRFVSSIQGEIASFPGTMLLLLIPVYVPLCYNTAQQTLPHHSEYEVKWGLVPACNLVIMSGFLIAFTIAMCEKLGIYH